MQNFELMKVNNVIVQNNTYYIQQNFKNYIRHPKTCKYLNLRK
jgi:hypothetical protein